MHSPLIIYETRLKKTDRGVKNPESIRNLMARNGQLIIILKIKK